MAIFFSGSELLEIARGIERNGAAFYQSLADNNPADEVKAIYSYLAGEEKKHLKIFEDMLTGVSEYKPPESYAGEYMLYLKSLVDNTVFVNIAEARKKGKTSSPVEALDIGIQAEKDSILFYGEMQNLVAKKDQQVISAVIGEEKNHLRKLFDLKKMQKK